MAKITIIRLAQSKNQYGSFSYRVVNGTPEPETKLYGEENNIIYSNQKIGIWNRPIEVEQFIGESKSGKTYTAFSIDKELNSFTQRGHTAGLAVKSGLDAQKLSMLKLLSELDEQELKVEIIRQNLNTLNTPNQPKAVNPTVSTTQFEEAEIIDESTNEELSDSDIVH